MCAVDAQTRAWVGVLVYACQRSGLRRALRRVGLPRRSPALPRFWWLGQQGVAHAHGTTVDCGLSDVVGCGLAGTRRPR